MLRRIALGLPMVVTPVAAVGALLTTGACTCGPCGGVIGTTVHPVDAAQVATIFAGTSAPTTTGCETVCDAYDVSRTVDAGIDAETSDAGGSGSLSGARVSCTVDPDTGGQRFVHCTYSTVCIGGRAPAGLVSAVVRTGGAGAWLARAAHLERASVAAFEELAVELELLGAPARLVRAARRAADDERRHAAEVGRLAERRGASVPQVDRMPTEARSLVELARDNAVEGCVREAYGALVAAHQAEHAADADVREAYRAIAADEARHALLSFAIHEWAMRRVSAEDALTVERARHDAIGAWRLGRHSDDAAALGLPSPATADALLAALV